LVSASTLEKIIGKEVDLDRILKTLEITFLMIGIRPDLKAHTRTNRIDSLKIRETLHHANNLQRLLAEKIVSQE
jgi:hypothetical protein